MGRRLFPRRKHRRAIVLRQGLAGGMQARFVGTSRRHSAFQIIGHQGLGGAAKVFKHPGVPSDPVGCRLRHLGFGIGQRARSQRRQEHLRLPLRSRLSVRVGNRHPGVFDECYLPRLMRDPENRMKFFGPMSIPFTKLRVTVAGRLGPPMFFSPQMPGHGFLAQFLVDPRPVRLRLLAD